MSKCRRILMFVILAVLSASASAKTNQDSSSSPPPPSSATPKKSLELLPINTDEVNENVLESEKVSTSTESPSSTIQLISSSTASATEAFLIVWECPNITKPAVECSCDFPHTLRCTGDRTALKPISEHLKSSREGSISLLDVTVTGISILPERFLEDVGLHGLVVSSGEIRRVNDNAFSGLSRPLQALGLPNNLLESVPIAALAHLSGLERLDLSHNKLKTLEADSFKGLTILTYLDLCDNLLSQLSPKAFEALRGLRSLRMRGNRLSVSALSALRGLKNLEELDLSSNLLVGPLGPNLLPPMPGLRFLTLSENELVNVQQGALAGLRNLTYLSLSHNQIDVLEDHSFKYLSTLTRLDLSNNRIVAISSASLANLERLTTLDVTHNFLRSLTADLIIPLKSLQDLRLDDNDITMVSSEVPTSKLRLKRLSLADNPLNCDCTLLEFANWLSNSSLEDADKKSAVCATPPALENGILTQVSPGSLLCGDPPTAPIMSRVPLAAAQLTLKNFTYNEKSTAIDMLWHVQPCTDHYTCGSLIVYEAIGESEIETESSPLHCDSQQMTDPCSLPVSVAAVTMNLQKGHKYRYCVVIEVPLTYDEFSLGLGCSDVLVLEETTPIGNDLFKSDTDHDGSTNQPEATTDKITDLISQDRITGVHVNISDRGFLHVDVSLASIDRVDTRMSPGCELSVAVFEGESAVHREKLNCTLSFVTMSGLVPGQYKVCASLDDNLTASSRTGYRSDFHDTDIGRSRCVEVQAFRQYNELIVIAVAVITCAVLVAVILLSRSILKRDRHPRIQAQCFLPAQDVDNARKTHYIKLLQQATTKV